MKYSKSICFVFFIIHMVFMPTNAKASGSISFEDVVMRLAGQSQKLMKEINTELVSNGGAISDIVCDGTRLGKHWKHLGGLRIPTFECAIGQKSLTVEGDVFFYDSKGKAGAEPMAAMYVALSDPKWTWK